MPSEETEERSQDIVQSQTSSQLYPKWMFWKRRRYIVGIYILLGYFCVYTLRTNMSMAIVAMTEEKNVTLDNGTVILEREFEWDSKIKGYVLGSYFYGYVTTVFFGGWISVKIGGKKVFAITAGLSGFFSLLTPASATVSVPLLLVVRVLHGMFQGAELPCVQAVWSKWAPPLERSKLSIIGFAGGHISYIIGTPMNGYLAALWGWPSIFYFSGTLTIIWTFAWCYFMAESPASDPRITRDELEYIQKSLGDVSVKRNTKVPFGKILTSAPVWAISISHFIDNWSFYTFLTQLPMFMKDKFDYDLTKIGIVSFFFFLSCALCTLFGALSADYLQQKEILTTTQVRKLFTFTAFVVSAIFMMPVGHITSKAATIACLLVSTSVGVFSWAGYGVNYLEVAPKFASVLMGLGNTLGTIAGVCSPVLTGHILSAQGFDGWRTVFYIVAVLKVIGGVQYVLLASGEAQPWATTEES